MRIILTLGFALLAGLLMTRIMIKMKLPNVTAYLIAGILIGPYCLGRLGIEGLGFISMENVEQYKVVGDVALGFIAFSIGNEFRLKDLKHIGKQAVVVGVVQALVTALVVDFALIILSHVMGESFPISYAITLGAIATATAPAATLMVVRQYGAKGKLTDILLPVVALDDAVGLIVFAISFGAANCIESGDLRISAILLEPILEIVLSLSLGALSGVLLCLVQKLFHAKRRVAVVIAFVLITVAVSRAEFAIGSIEVGFSSLLTCMMLGTMFCNLNREEEEIMHNVEQWTVPLNALFFVISGAELELNVFTNVSALTIGVVYIIFRCVGKYIGSLAGCKMTHCDHDVTKNLGITLWPQAGVALGMCVTIMDKWGEQGALIRNIVLFAVLIYELAGPVLTKHALIRTGDIKPENIHGVEH